MILAGDVGGTKVHLGLYDLIDGKLENSRDARFPAKNYSGLKEIVKEFLGAQTVTAAMRIGAIKKEALEPELKIPLASARSSEGNHSVVALMAGHWTSRAGP